MKNPLHGWKAAWTECIAIVVALRVMYAIMGMWVVSSVGSIPLREAVYGLVEPYLASDRLSQVLVNPWFKWDTISYLKIAILGYHQDASTAFMPLYPLLIRLVAPVVGANYLLAALLLSTIFCIIALILIRELFTEIYSDKIAGDVVILFVSFPTAFFLLAGYTESLFLCLVLAFWKFARGKKWTAAALCAGVATLARLQGVILAPVLLWMIVVSHIDRPAPGLTGQIRQILGLFNSWRQDFPLPARRTFWAAPVAPLLVAASYQAWLKFAGFGSISDALRTYWKLETVPPWTGFILFLQRLPSARFTYMDWVDLVLFAVVLLAALAGLRLLDPAFSIYIWLTIAVLLTRGTPPHLLASYSRYFLALFPLFVLPALWKHRYQRLLLISVFLGLHIVLAGIFLWGSWVA